MPVRKYHSGRASDSLLHNYMVYRFSDDRRESKTSLGRTGLQMRQVVETVCAEIPDADFNTIMCRLCWASLRRLVATERYSSADIPRDLDIGQDLLCAASYLNLIPLAKRLLDKGSSPDLKTWIFPAPIQLAASSGHMDMVRLLQTKMPLTDMEDAVLDRGTSEPHTMIPSIMGAAESGNLEMFRLACQPYMNCLDKLKWNLECTYRETASWDFFAHAKDMIASIDSGGEISTESLQQEEIDSLVAYHAGLGNFDMVRHLIQDMGGNPEGSTDYFGNALMQASRAGHEGIVNMLLDRGAEPNFCDLLHSGTPLAAAVSGGSLSIVKTLHRRGARLHYHGALCEQNPAEDRCHQASLGYVRYRRAFRDQYPGRRSAHRHHVHCWWPLLLAVGLEHTAMVQYLLDNDACDAASKRMIYDKAVQDGLESMADMLRPYVLRANGRLVSSRSHEPLPRRRSGWRMRYPGETMEIGYVLPD